MIFTENDMKAIVSQIEEAERERKAKTAALIAELLDGAAKILRQGLPSEPTAKDRDHV